MTLWYVLLHNKDGRLRGSVGPFSTEDNAHDHARRVVLPSGIELTLTVEPRWRCASLRVDHMSAGIEWDQSVEADDRTRDRVVQYL